MKIIPILALLVLFFVPSAHAATITLYGDEDYPPYSYVSNGRPKGLYVDLIRAAFARMEDYDLNLFMHPYKRILTGIREGTNFAFFPPYSLPKLRPWIDTYSAPLFSEEPLLYCSNEVAAKRSFVLWPESVYGLRVGTNIGYQAGGAQFHWNSAHGKIKISQGLTTLGTIKMLINNRIDCYMNDRQVILYTIRQGGISDIFHQTAKEVLSLGVQDAFIGFSRYNNPPYKADFIKKFNTALQQLKDNGEYDAIYQKHFH